MYEMKTLKANDLLEYLNNNKGEIAYLEDTHDEFWTLVFRKTVMGRPKRVETEPNVVEPPQEDVDDTIDTFGFPQR